MRHPHSHILSYHTWEKMRTDILVGGIIILFMGIAGHYWMKRYIVDCLSSSNTNGPVSLYLGQICEQLKLVQIGAIFSAVTGFCIMVYGGLARKQIVKTS
ncbi:MAG: hypothetical protein ACREAE_09935 [Nitrosopumilaceae archaeon]